MKKKIRPSDCKNMFNDKFSSLSMKELGIELKHLSVGTAPENPSFLVNQEELKEIIVKKFSIFFDEDKSQGLEMIFLKSNYGNGKSHFIKSIYSFLSNYENIYTRKISLKQEKEDLKFKILEAVSQKTLKDCATYFVNEAITNSGIENKEVIISNLIDNYSISSVLAELLYYSTNSEDISMQTKAIAILKGNYLSEYLKSFKLKAEYLNSGFYFNTIRLLCDYLRRKTIYLAIIFDEYEHIFSWKDKNALITFAYDLKKFTDDIEIYKNLLLIFAESEASSSKAESLHDPAFNTRKPPITFTISNISSFTEVEKLYKMIRTRYEKYYDISLDEFSSQILEELKNNLELKSKTDYRAYTTTIMKILDEYRNHPPKVIKKTINGTFEQKWLAATSIAKKTILCDALEHVIKHSNEKIVDKKVKNGIIHTQINDDRLTYCVVATDHPSTKDCLKRHEIAFYENELSKFVMLYPRINSTDDYILIQGCIFYDSDKIPAILETIYANTDHIENVIKYLMIFESEG